MRDFAGWHCCLASQQNTAGKFTREWEMMCSEYNKDRLLYAGKNLFV
jgi:hypothetical protein